MIVVETPPEWVVVANLQCNISGGCMGPDPFLRNLYTTLSRIVNRWLNNRQKRRGETIARHKLGKVWGKKVIITSGV